MRSRAGAQRFGAYTNPGIPSPRPGGARQKAFMKKRVLPVFPFLPKLAVADFKAHDFSCILGVDPVRWHEIDFWKSPQEESSAIFAAVSAFSSATCSRTLAFSENWSNLGNRGRGEEVEPAFR